MGKPIIALLSFISGFIFCIGVIVAFALILDQTGLGDIFKSEVYARGELIYEPAEDSSLSALPPEGYYIPSSTMTRVYVERTDSIEEFLNRSVQVRGTLKTICGADIIDCYPELKDVNIVPIN